ncbi:TPA: LuxR C-terminal-related transcriptional regulator [Serratia fonticola]|uniref:LuxR family transcriptional regulator n=1 Tax=Serratia fonticola TaxID=47917 RepID=UPI0021799887|nr:LuxR family transcriptional regulator [Serratia fonticola]CAI1725651.1 Nitrogen regulation protein C [Serratia fonticola]
MCKRHLTIFSSDQNTYFTYGMGLILDEHFSEKEISMNFTTDINNYRSADIAFIPANSTESRLPQILCSWMKISCPILFIVADSNLEMIIKTPISKRKYHFFSKNQSIETLKQQIDNALQQDELLQNVPLRFSPRQYLTAREIEIMQCIITGMKLGHIAQKLNISVKTVSHHKRNVMRKLNFKRNAELFYWLQYGGLHEAML